MSSEGAPLPEVIDFSDPIQCREMAEMIAAHAGVQIPPEISLVFWSLPVLAVLLSRINSLEQEVRKLNSQVRIH